MHHGLTTVPRLVRHFGQLFWLDHPAVEHLLPRALPLLLAVLASWLSSWWLQTQAEKDP